MLTQAELDQLGAALRGPLKGDDLTETLDCVDRMGIQFAKRFARPRPQFVDTLSGEKRRHRDQY